MTDSNLTYCDTCGREFTWYELAETIEERLCEYCASGIDDYDNEDYDDHAY